MECMQNKVFGTIIMIGVEYFVFCFLEDWGCRCTGSGRADKIDRSVEFCR